jgi:DNA-binding NarL/FixJ family response regulator
MGEHDSLTNREHEVLNEVAKGKRNREIAEDLGISEATVENHIHHVFEKLGVSNRTQAARYAMDDSQHGDENRGNPS